MNNVITLTQNLIACPSVTPEDAGAQAMLSAFLEEAGFTCHHLPFGKGGEYVPNLFAHIGTGEKHLCYAGHTDVVPPGPADKWTYGAFTPTIKDGVLYGRGASDMKGSVAAFACAAARYIEKHGAPEGGSISMLITGDEEGPAENGTIKVLEWMAANGHIPSVALVGEPTNPSELGQEIKIGRRGSLSGTLTVSGKQGHVAYPHLADNPMPRLIKMVDALCDYTFDKGTEFFAATNLEVTSIDVGNTASNVIPASGRAVFNIRFNDTWNGASLSTKLHDILKSVGGAYELSLHEGSESFMTKPGEWSETVSRAVAEITGKTPVLTTSGGTSDARFVHKYCPVVEFGPINATIHQIDENAKVADLESLVEIYERVITLYFA